MPLKTKKLRVIKIVSWLDGISGVKKYSASNKVGNQKPEPSKNQFKELCTKINFDFKKREWTDGKSFENKDFIKKWKNMFGGVWNSYEKVYPREPYQPDHISLGRILHERKISAIFNGFSTATFDVNNENDIPVRNLSLRKLDNQSAILVDIDKFQFN